MKDYRLKVSIRNNRILWSIEDAGYASISEFCRAFGLRYQTIINLVGMKIPAIGKKGQWLKASLDLAGALSMNPEDLFNERQILADFSKTRIEKEIDELPMISIGECKAELIDGPDKQIEDCNLAQFGMEILNSREQRIINWRFGIQEPAWTLKEVAREENVTQERIRQIEAKAIRKMRKKLRVSYVTYGTVDRHTPG